MERIRADLIVFDLDGTLVDSGRDIANAVNHVREKVGLKPMEAGEVLKHVGSGLRKTLHDSLDDFSRNSEELVAGFVDYYGRHMLDNARLYGPVKDVLAHFRDKRKVVVSNKLERYSRRILEALGVSDHFEFVMGRDSVEKPKPDPEPLFCVSGRTGVPLERMVLVGDGENDINCANAAGVRCIAAGYGFGEPDSLRALNPSCFIGDLGEIKDILE